MNMRVEYVTARDLAVSDVREAPVVIAMPATDFDQAHRSAQLMARRSAAPGLILVVLDERREGYIPTCNLAFRQTRSEFFAYVAQDAFAGRLWLKIALNQMNKTGKDMLAFNDGKWHGLMASFGMARRSWAQRHYDGDFFFPEYQSHYGDAELTLLAKAHDRLCYAPRSVMIEVDWEKDDKLANDADRKLFKRRAAHRFDGRVPAQEDCHIFPEHMQRAVAGTVVNRTTS